jgi:hypothetical protein
MDKSEWLDFWNLSGEAGEKAWEAKQYMDGGHKQSAHHVMADMQPYQSMVDGSMIEGRRQHREHLKSHKLIEVGNEVKHLKGYGDYRPKGVKQDLIREFKRVTGRD